MPAAILCPVSDFTGWAWTTPRSPAAAPRSPYRHLELCGIALTFWKQQKRLAAKKSNRPEAVGHLYKTHFENRSSPLPILCDTAKKKAVAISLPQLFGGSWWIRTTEALSSRFTVCPHWPLGKAPIFCFVSAVSPGDVCYYSKGVSKLQAFFWIFLRFFQKSLFCSQYRVKTILDILLRLAYIYI